MFMPLMLEHSNCCLIITMEIKTCISTIQLKYLFFYIKHLVKNIRNNLLNWKKFVFAEFSFGGFTDYIEIPNGFISWEIFYVYEKDSKLQVTFRKASKFTYGAIHPGNKKQSMPLALAIFDESTTGAIKCYFPLAIKCHFFFFSVSKTLCYMQFQNTTLFPIYLKMQLFVMILSQNFYYLLIATKIEQWSTYQNFSLAKQASQAVITTLKATSCLLSELLNERYKYVLTRFQRDPLE